MSPLATTASPDTTSPAPGDVPVLPRTLVDDLRKIVGADGVITDPGRLLVYESDGLTAYRHPPGAVVLPRDTAQASAALARLHAAGIPVVPRGAGTGLSGGALATGGAVALCTARMDRILEVDAANRRARVQAGVVNARLSAATRPLGLHYAPDPSSQSACTLGGNVAENSGGPHCLKYGVTSRYVTGLTLVLPDGAVVELGGAERGPAGYDLVGLVVGSEGCFGVVTEIDVGLVPVPEDVRTLLAIFDRIEDAGRAVTRIIGSGLLPAALEIVDGETIRAVEASVYAAGYPVDADAALVVEFDGTAAGLDAEAEAAASCCREEGAREVRRARSAAEREALWKGRKKAFGAMGRIAPDLLVQDATVPRSRLPEVLARVREIGERYDLTVANVFHAGDGNLHPNILFDRRDAGTVERVERASREMMEACVEAGGTITGEHGVGVDKRAYMSLVLGPDELEAMAAVREVFDPEGRFNRGKVLPDGVEPARPSVGPAAEDEGRGRLSGLDPAGLVERVLGSRALAGGAGPWPAAAVALPETAEQAAELMRAASREGVRVLPAGLGTWLHGGGSPGDVDLVVSTRRMDRILQYEPADLTLTAGAGVTLDRVREESAAHGQWLPLDPPGGSGSLGATLATASSGLLRTRYGDVRDQVLGLVLVTGDGRVLRLGGKVVKNVAGFDLVRPVIGSWGTLGLITEATVRLHPAPGTALTLRAVADRMEDLLPAAGIASSGGAADGAAGAIVPGAVELREEPLPDGGRRALLIVTLHGSEPSVRAEARRLRGAVPELEEVQEARPGPEPIEDPDLVLRMTLPRSALADLVAISRTLGRLEGGRDVLEGARVVLSADPGTGALRVVAPNVRTDDGWGGRWVVRIEDLRRTLRARGGGLTVEAAPGLSAEVGAWRTPEAREGALMARLRDCFDPARILAPERFEF